MNAPARIRPAPSFAGLALLGAALLAVVLGLWAHVSWAHRQAQVQAEARQVAQLHATSAAATLDDLRRSARALDVALSAPGAAQARTPSAQLAIALREAFPLPARVRAAWIAADGRTVLAATPEGALPSPPTPSDVACGPLPGDTVAPGLFCTWRRTDGSRIVVAAAVDGRATPASASTPTEPLARATVLRRTDPASPAAEPAASAFDPAAVAEGVVRRDAGSLADIVAWSDVADSDLRVVATVPLRPVAIAWFRDTGGLFVLALLLLAGSTAGGLSAYGRLRRRERDLREAHDRLELATRHARLGVWDHRLGDASVACNDLLAGWLGLPAQGRRPTPAAVLATVHPDDRDRVAAGYEAALRDRGVTTWDTEHRLVGPGGVRWVRSSCRIVRDAFGRAVRCVGVTLDVSAEREAALTLDAQSLVEARDRDRRRFLQQASQALRTPLNGMIGLAQVLAVRAQSHAGLQAQARHIEQAGWHLAALLDDLMDLSLLQEGQLGVAAVPVPVGPTLRDVATLVQRDTAARGVVLACEPTDACVLADPDRLLQVLRAVVVDAVAHGRRDGHVRVRVQADERVVRIEVADSGRGLTDGERARLFEPFERVRLDPPALGATGLGLAIARALAEAMGGGLSVDGPSSAGTTVTLTLPRAAASAPRPSDAAEPDVDRSAPTGAALILVVEDDDVNALCLIESVRLLRPGWTVERAATLAEADDRLRCGQPDLVFLDLHLPDGHSLEHLARGDRPLSRLDRHRIVVLSADVAPGVRQHGLASGVRDVLGKPFHLGDIRAVVEQVGLATA